MSRNEFSLTLAVTWSPKEIALVSLRIYYYFILFYNFFVHATTRAKELVPLLLNTVQALLESAAVVQ